MQLHALIRRKEGMSREDFLHYWQNVHGPLIRDTPSLADRLLRYEQHPSHPKDRSGFDGVAVQEFAGWDDFLAMLEGPAGDAMSADEANFIDRKDIVVVFTDDPVVMVDRRLDRAPGDGPPDVE
jgi:uncharacterized protein (TIGR02118 family)